MSEYTFLSKEQIQNLKKNAGNIDSNNEIVSTYLHSIRKEIEDTISRYPSVEYIYYKHPSNGVDRRYLEQAVNFLKTKGYTVRKEVAGWHIEFPKDINVEIKLDPPNLDELCEAVQMLAMQNVKAAINKFKKLRKSNG